MDPDTSGRAEHEHPVETPDPDKLAADLNEASAAFRAGEGGVETKDAARMRRLLALWAAVAFAFAALSAILYAIIGEQRRLGLGATVNCVIGSTALVAYGMARRGRLEQAAIVFGYAHFVVMPIVCILIPDAYAVCVIVPIFALALMQPYLRGARVWTTLILAWMAVTLSAVVGVTWPTQRMTPTWVVPVLVIVGTASVSLLTMIQHAHFAARLREQLARLEAGNARLNVLAKSSLDMAATNSRLFTAAERELAERKRAESKLGSAQAQLQQAQKMEAVGRLAGGVAHDFNNMLSVILSYAELGTLKLPAGHPVREHLGEIHKAGDRAAALTRQLLAFSRQQALPPALVDPNEVLTGMDKMLRALLGDDIELNVILAPALGIVRIGQGQLEQIVMNLAVNARDAMSDGGKVTLETENVNLDEGYARDHLGVIPGAYVMLAITDTGTGMDKATQDRMFEPFFTTKERGKGTGLGLATVFGIVSQAAGSIWVYSELGRGTTFKVYLPRTAGLPGPVVIPSVRPALSDRGTETVLLVEDEEPVRNLVQELLRSHGYDVLVAPNPTEALRIAAQHTGEIHLLLTDVIMPGLDGRALADRLQQQRRQLKVIFMSGYSGNVVVHHGVLEEGVAFLQKPIMPAPFLRSVRDVLEAPRSRDP
jgi:signal transduction histidine kinase